jgi:hypothetical protein
VTVEEERGTVEGDRGLPRARTALDDEEAGERAADDGVLLGLDGGDDIAHPAGAMTGQSREQGSFALQVRPLIIVEGLDVEHIVLDPGDLPVGGHEVTAAGDAFGGGRGRLVETLRGRCSPVDEDLLTLRIGETDAADVGGVVLVDEVEATEAQSLLGAVEADELIFVQGGEGITFGAVLVVASDLGDPHGSEARCRLLPQLIESGIELVELGLLDANF